MTIRDVARRAVVSVTTVSKALNEYPDVNESTRARIHDIAREIRIHGESHRVQRKRSFSRLIREYHLAVVGFDDVVWAPLVSPSLTTVRQNFTGWASSPPKCFIR